MTRARKVCAHPGCPVIVDTGHCPDHARKPWSNGRHDVNGQPRTGTATHKAWRRAVLARDRYQCQIRGPGCTGRATIADHVRPVAWGGPEHDIANGQAVCATCHDAKTRAESIAGRRRGMGGTP